MVKLSPGPTVESRASDVGRGPATPSRRLEAKIENSVYAYKYPNLRAITKSLQVESELKMIFWDNEDQETRAPIIKL